MDTAEAIADINSIRTMPGGDKLSAEMTLLIALLTFDDYLPFPSAAQRAAREPKVNFPKDMPTDSPDRSFQYTRATNEELLRSLNEAWATIRRTARAIGTRDEVIHELHQKLEKRDKTIAQQQRQLDFGRVKNWAMGLLLAAQWGMIGWLANALLSRSVK